MPSYLNNPYYGHPDFATPMNNLARALIGSAQEDADLARSRANDALAARYGVEQQKLGQEAEKTRLQAEQLRNLQRSRDALAGNERVQSMLQRAFGIDPLSDGTPAPIMYDYAQQYFGRDGNIDQFAHANQRVQGTGLLMDPFASENDRRRGGALLGLEPDKNTAYTYGTADDINEKDRQVIRDRDQARDTTARRGQDISSTDRRRGQDIGSADRRRGQDISSTDRRRGQDLASDDRQRGQDLRGTGKGGGSKPAIFGGGQEKAANKILNELLGGDEIDDDLREQIMGRASELYQDSKNIRTAVQDAFDEVTSGEDSTYEEVPWYKPGKSGYRAKEGAKKPKGGSPPAAAAPAAQAAPKEVAAPPVQAIDYLRKNPQLRSDFDKKYGAGAADRYLKK